MLSQDCTVSSVAAAARAHMRDIDSEASLGLIDRVSVFVEELFAGLHPDYQKADLKYHNLDHTVLATQCFIDLCKGRVRHREKPVLNARQFALGYAAILLHDSGYLKTRDDVTGTGAKYTSSHVVRSCALAASALPGVTFRKRGGLKQLLTAHMLSFFGMIVVLDTNIFVSALLGKGASRAVLRACLEGRLQPLMGAALFAEYESLMGRESVFRGCRLPAQQRDELLNSFLSVCRWTTIYYGWRPNLRDEGDNHLIELAVAGSASSPAGATPIDPRVGRSGISNAAMLKREPQFTAGIAASRSNRTTPRPLSMIQR